MKTYLLLPVVAVVFAVAGCANTDEVRRACADHDGVNAVNGSQIRKYVACRDGHYEVVR